MTEQRRLPNPSYPVSPFPRVIGMVVPSVIITMMLLEVGFDNKAWPQSNAPNIVMIMSDDMGYSDLGCYGGEIETPHLDALAEQGLRLTNFYCDNMCVVSRAMLLTGVWHQAARVGRGLNPRCVTLPEALRENGYTTWMAGKWHLGAPSDGSAPPQRGFDRFFGIIDGAASFFAPNSLMRGLENAEDEFLNPDFYLTDALTDEAVAAVKTAPRDRPLFLYLAYTAAHWPLHALPQDIAHYEGRYAKGWDSLRRERLQRMKKLGVIDPGTPLSPRHAEVPAWENEPHKAWQQRRMEVYAAQVTCMDRGIGRVVRALKESGRFQNSLILYTVDNGGCHVEYTPDRKGDYLPETTRDGRPMRVGNLPDIMPGPEDTYCSYGYGWANASNTPYRLFKKYDHEGGIHTPLIVHWPGQIEQPGGVTDQVAHIVDVMPTLLDVTDTRLPDWSGGHRRLQLDGKSMLPIFHGDKRRPHDFLFFQHAKGAAVRQGNWKLVRRDKLPWELYDLEADPNELHDLAQRFPERARDLARRWEEWSREQARRAKTE